MINVLDKFIQDMKTNVPGFIAVSVTEVRSGVSYGAESVDPSFDPNLASAYNLEVVKAKQNALQILGLASKEKIEDILITLTNQIHIIDIAASGGYFIYLAVDSSKANLGLTRALLAKYKKDLAAIF
ncbi:hypothetical protein [Capnocytophaga sputigena]|jgi:hypothetical protein|uniref:Roadblock/LAMTOR2 domain-containing protein n=1 Tax=Capnocytophaga sputigena TaxID=1019 RepID=A0A2A3N730_CAPSP|nr:hypothetical protein [Capnocytophaga sputigena]ATA70910.1 hypothetical protein CGC57_08340 [Capnocytophaga sputigena]ATA79880.1 hypothetical protein CGC59_09390 [Capnocytophaga sputigena]ATA84583.1 hypothetical protein CGC55_08725 [Capnocytophaga sputigena]EEB66625.1 hypothetical protein CAPSP0001_1123 [Capnocytophaga sputigena ATCC 33612]PBN47450.1 hypothetical protein CDC50_02360 [Capnocytophaga sputigena]